MQKIGRVLHVSPGKNVIIKAEKPPKIGVEVVDERLKPVGTVFDVFGPVASPYVAVKPRVKGPRRLVHHVLYVAPKTNREKGEAVERR